MASATRDPNTRLLPVLPPPPPHVKAHHHHGRRAPAELPQGNPPPPGHRPPVPPTDHPAQVVCIGRNYADHIHELQHVRPKQPFFFLKPPSSILPPGHGPVLRPRGVRLHFEVELGVVVGATTRDLRCDDGGDGDGDGAWRRAVAGYVLGVDMTARNVQDEARGKGLPWSIAKGFDTFLPVGEPVAAGRIADPHDVELWLRVNGRERQRDSTALMLFGIPRVLSEISKVMTLEEGDVVLTGTPKGVGAVEAGDVLEAGMRVGGKEVEGAGIRVEVRDRDGPYEFTET